MIKVTLINVDSVTPKSVELNAGAIVISADAEGIKTDISDESDFAIKINMKKGRVIAIRF